MEASLVKLYNIIFFSGTTKEVVYGLNLYEDILMHFVFMYM